ncbi:hypothetical protein FRC01_007010, partial [Tulasnella sp. 417]
RWRSLVLAGRMTYEVQTQLINLPNPRLINLSMIRSGFIPLRLESAGTPLRELSLCYAAIDWGSPRLTGLRDLRLHKPRFETPTIEQLYAILSSSPNLEILDLAFWNSTLSDWSQSKTPGVLLLLSLTTLAAEDLPPPVLHMLLSCIRAPNCKYIRLPSISQDLLRNNGSESLKGLAKLCQGPLSTVPRLLVSYDRASGSYTITHRATELAPQPNIRESSVKLAKRRGVYLRTERVFYPDLDEDILQSNEAGVRRFIQEVVQPALRNLSFEVQLDLHHRWPRPSDTPSNPPKSLITELLLNVPVFTHLRIRAYFDPITIDVLRLISTPQLVQKMDGEAGPELSWPMPLMETLTIAYNKENDLTIFRCLEVLISKRGPHIHPELAMGLGQPREREAGPSHPPRSLKHIVMQDKNEQNTQEWDSEQGWRPC